MDPTTADALRMARYLSRIAFVTRGIGILGVIGSVIGLLVALDQRSSSDRLGFSLISLCVLLIAVVVWSTGTFHGTMARMAPLVARLDQKLDQAVADRDLLATKPSAVNPFLQEPSAPSPRAEADPDTDRMPEPQPPARVARVPEPKPEPAKIPCPSCGGPIHPEATRCVHCMKRVAHA